MLDNFSVPSAGISKTKPTSRWHTEATVGTGLGATGDLPVIGKFWLDDILHEDFKTVAKATESVVRSALQDGKDMHYGAHLCVNSCSLLLESQSCLCPWQI